MSKCSTKKFQHSEGEFFDSEPTKRIWYIMTLKNKNNIIEPKIRITLSRCYFTEE